MDISGSGTEVDGLKDSFVDAEVVVEELVEVGRVCVSLRTGTACACRGRGVDIVSCRRLILHIVLVRDLEDEASAES